MTTAPEAPVIEEVAPTATNPATNPATNESTDACLIAPEPIQADSDFQEFETLYKKFQHDMLALGGDVYKKWLELWSKRLQNTFRVPVSCVNVAATIPNGTPPQHFEKLVDAFKSAEKTVTRIEYDADQKVFRLYASPVTNG